MTSLTNKLSEIVGAAFEAQGLDSKLGVVRVSDRPDLAQFQCNGAMAAAKIAKKNPREVAQAVVDTLLSDDLFSKVEIAGPGFININLADSFLEDYLTNLDNYGVAQARAPEKMVFDYGGPNAAKSLHVGHLRAAIIGNALRHIFKFKGHDVLGDIHLGDWGTQMGMLIGDYIREGQADLLMQADPKNADDVEKIMADFSVRYPKASSAAKEDEALMQEARDITARLQNKEQPFFDMWQKIRDISLADMSVIYSRLSVVFDLWKGEADVNDYIPPMVEDFKVRNIAYEDQGAMIVDVALEDDNKKIPPLILTKSDGAALYSTTDIATIIERMKLYNPSRILYVVDQRQALHFEQVFRVVRKADIVTKNTELTHAGFGTMNGTDGTPFKTRAGGVMPLKDFINQAVEKACARLDEAQLAEDIDAQEREDIAEKVGLAAIKFADLQNPRQSDYIFDIDRMISFEGKTGPYLLYQTVRIKSLLKKAKNQNVNFEKSSFIIQEADRDLALLLGEFSDAIDLSIQHYAPHYLCDYIYKLAQAFSSFYGSCHILSEEDEALRDSRLLLSQKTADALEQGLSLLGISVPDRM